MCNVHLIGVKMHKARVVLKMSQIRKANTSLRNWANEQESDNLHFLLKSAIIRTKADKVVLKGTVAW